MQSWFWQRAGCSCTHISTLRNRKAGKKAGTSPLSKSETYSRRHTRRMRAVRFVHVFWRSITTASNSRGDMIRTCDLLVPNQALYQAELRPECGSCQKPPKRSQSIAKTDKRQSSKEKSREQGTFLVFEELQQAFEFLRTTEWDDNSSCSFAVCMNHDFCANSSPKLIFK